MTLKNCFVHKSEKHTNDTVKKVVYSTAAAWALTMPFPMPATAAPKEQVIDATTHAPLKAITLEGGPITTHHYQSTYYDYNQKHTLGIVKFETRNYGTWGLYVLSPNSMNRTSVGIGYLPSSLELKLPGSLKAEFSVAVGLTSGYREYPVPLISGEVRLGIYEKNNWDIGITVAAMPYIYKTWEQDKKVRHTGIVVTSPFLSIRRKF